MACRKSKGNQKKLIKEHSHSRKDGLDTRHDNQDTAKVSPILWACRSNGRGKIAKAGIRRLFAWKKKQRMTEEKIDGWNHST